jgi:ABC-2 type transport system permease protein
MSQSAVQSLELPFVFLRRDFSIAKSYRLSFIYQTVGTFFSVFMFYFIARLVGETAAPSLAAYGGAYFPFVLIGIAFYRFLGVGLSAFSNSIREGQITGTFEAMLATPTRPVSILICSSLWPFLFAAYEVLLYLFLGAAFFGFQAGNANLLSVTAVLLVTLLCFSGFGLLSAAFVVRYKRGDPVLFVAGTLSALLGGTYYPVSILPEMLQKCSALLPLTYSLRAMRLAILQGAPVTQLAGDLTVLALFAAVGLPASLFLFGRALRCAKEEGTLLQY